MVRAYKFRDDALDDIVDLRSLPAYRQIRGNRFIDRIRSAVPFDHVSVSGLDLDGYRLGEANFHIESDVPPAIVEVYVADGLYATDPLLEYARTTKCVALESIVYAQSNASERLKELASGFEIRNRTVFPIQRGDLVFASVCFMRREAFDDDEMEFLRAIAHPIYLSVAGPTLKRFAAESARLTDGELLCLRLASNGLTTQQISEQSAFQPTTIDTYFKSATRKLGCQNRAHAIAEAIRRGII